VVANIGVIGCGVMGSDHAALLYGSVASARLAAVQDFDVDRATALSARLGHPRVMDSAEGLITDPNIDGVLIAASDDTHAGLTLAAIAAGKPVLCEKPLAATLEDCRRIIEGEMAGGRRLVTVGFMRRFDPGYHAMRSELKEGKLGHPLFLHCIHRNKIAPNYITSDLVIANSAVHEMDISRFLLGEDLAAITVVSGPPSRYSAARQPQLIVLETVSGVVITVEKSPDARYGYEVQGELVCEDGTVSLTPPRPIFRRHAGHEGVDIDEDWRPRFRDAYRLQLQDWVAAIRDGCSSSGATAWDGYQASRTAEAGLEALRKRQRITISNEPRPSFYD
jgi:myo-inositol 2-dehydrogenase / D-chiro-inositol 1-dehydrogenase